MLIKPFTMKITAVGISLFLVFYLGFYILYYRILLTGLGREEFLSDLGVRELIFNKFIFAVLCISVALMLTGISGVFPAVIKNAADTCRGVARPEKQVIKISLTVSALLVKFWLIILIPDFYFNNIAQASKKIAGEVRSAAVYICGFTAASGLIAAAVRSGFKKAVKISAVFLLGAAGLF